MLDYLKIKKNPLTFQEKTPFRKACKMDWGKLCFCDSDGDN